MVAGAVGAGLIAGVLLFVPFVALSYRRRGRLTPGRAVMWAGALVYFWAIWAFTLLPLPDRHAFTCAGRNLNLLLMRSDALEAVARHGGVVPGLLGDVVILQIALNVVLFLPFGFFLRTLAGRGVLSATLLGFGLSLFIEVTQLTGVWGIYPCAYRVFDVDDLLLNTVGALLGSLCALMVPGTREEIDPAAPRPVTRARRMLAMICDLLSYALASATVTVVLGIADVYGVIGIDDPLRTAGLAAAVLVLICVLVTGGTPGDHAVRLRYGGGPVARVLRFIGGIGGCALLLCSGFPVLGAAWAAIGVSTWVLTVRGLPGVLSGRMLLDARTVRN